MRYVEIGSIDFRERVGVMGIKLGQLKGLASCLVGAVEVIVTIRPETEK